PSKAGELEVEREGAEEQGEGEAPRRPEPFSARGVEREEGGPEHGREHAPLGEAVGEASSEDLRDRAQVAEVEVRPLQEDGRGEKERSMGLREETEGDDRERAARRDDGGRRSPPAHQR